MARNDYQPEPDVFEMERGSPYRRRPRAVAVSRSGVTRRAKRALHWVLIGLLVIAPLAYGIAWLVQFARGSSQFGVTAYPDVTTEGNQVVSRQEIMEALDLNGSDAAPSDANAFRILLSQERKRIEAIAWVRSAILSRAYPHRLDVRVVERSPVAFVNVEGRVKLIDGDGVVLEKPDRGAFDFPVLEGVGAIGGAAERRSRVALFQQFINDWRPEGSASGWMLSEVDLSDREDLKTLLVQGQDTILVHFGHQDFAARFHTFLTLLPEVRKTTPKIDSVDLRFPGQLVVNPDTPKPSAPLAAGRPAPGAIESARNAAVRWVERS